MATRLCAGRESVGSPFGAGFFFRLPIMKLPQLLTLAGLMFGACEQHPTPASEELKEKVAELKENAEKKTGELKVYSEKKAEELKATAKETGAKAAEATKETLQDAADSVKAGAARASEAVDKSLKEITDRAAAAGAPKPAEEAPKK